MTRSESYALGIDVGSTTTAAAICRGGRVEMVGLSARGHTMPTAVYAREDGGLIVGDAAVLQLGTAPERVAIEFKRDIALPHPRMLGVTPVGHVELFGAVLAHVRDVVTKHYGAPPAHTTLTHPAEWGDGRRDLLAKAAELAGYERVGFCPEPFAAATHYASLEHAQLPTGTTLAVYDFGGATFDVAVVRKTADSLDVRAHGGADALGGANLDESLLRHILAALDPIDPSGASGSDRVALQRLATDVRDRKEQLSVDIDAVVPVLLPGQSRQVRITRHEFEDIARPIIAQSVSILGDVLRAAKIDPQDLNRILLVGGTSLLPLVPELVAGAFPGVALYADAHPKWPIALGAAIVASTAGTSRGAPAAARVDVSPAGASIATAVPAAAPPEPVPASPDTYRIDLATSRITGIGDVPIQPAADLRPRPTTSRGGPQVAAEFGPADVDDRRSASTRSLAIVAVLTILLTCVIIVIAVIR